MLTQAKRTIFVLENAIGSTRRLQNRIVRNGGNLLVANEVPHALLIAENAALHDAVIDWRFAGCDEVIAVLRKREVPYIFYCEGDQGGLPGAIGSVRSAEFSAIERRETSR